jgi:DNA-binding GntR family transcriptional regulator
LYDLREVLESFALPLAIARLTRAEERQLTPLAEELNQLAGRGDEIEEQRVGQRVHEILARATGNDLLRDTLLRLYDRAQLFLWIDVLYADPLDETRREHHELINAVLQRDKKAAVAIARAHVRRSKQNVLRVATVRERFATGSALLGHGRTRRPPERL